MGMEMTHMQRSVPRKLRRNVELFSFLKLNVKLVPTKVGGETAEVSWKEERTCGTDSERECQRACPAAQRPSTQHTEGASENTQGHRSASSLAKRVGLRGWGHQAPCLQQHP